jgi:hypothetical protein
MIGWQEVRRMKTVVMGSAVSIGLWLALGAPAIAHHSASAFDMGKTVAIQGKVKEFQYTNPHAWLIVTVVEPDGTTDEWSFQAEGPSTLMRYGIKHSSLQPGDEITVKANPMKDGRHAGIWVSLTKADGTVLAPRGPLPSG